MRFLNQNWTSVPYNTKYGMTVNQKRGFTFYKSSTAHTIMFWVVISCLPVVNSLTLRLQMMSLFLTWKFLAPRKLKLWHQQHTDDRPVGCGANLAEERIDGTEKHRMIFARLEDSLTCLLVMASSANLWGKTVKPTMVVILVGISFLKLVISFYISIEGLVSSIENRIWKYCER